MWKLRKPIKHYLAVTQLTGVGEVDGSTVKRLATKFGCLSADKAARELFARKSEFPEGWGMVNKFEPERGIPILCIPGSRGVWVITKQDNDWQMKLQRYTSSNLYNFDANYRLLLKIEPA